MKSSINRLSRTSRPQVLNTPPITLIERSVEAYLYPEEPVLLHSNVDISCGDKIFKNRPRARYFRDYYGNIFDYLKKKKLPLNVSRFRKKELGDIVEDIQSHDKSSISLNRLVEIYSYENQIAAMRIIAIKRLKTVEYKRWWRQYKKFLDNREYNQADEMRSQFEEKRKIESDIANFHR